MPRQWLIPEGASRPTWWFRDGELRSPEPMLSADNIANIREEGIALVGPDARDMLPPVSPDQVRAAVREMLADTPDLTSERSAAKELLDIARSLAALETGRPTSHAAGLRWALTHVDPRWHAPLQRAQELRAGADVSQTDEGLRRVVAAWRASLGLRS